MDLHCILVSIVVNLSHGSALYWSTSMMRNHLYMSKKVLMYCKSLVDDDLRSSDFLPRSDNLLFQSSLLSYPYSLMLWGNSVTHKSHHHHVFRPKTTKFSLNFQIVKLDIGLDSYFPYLSPPLPFPLMQKALPSSVTPIVY